MLTAFIILMIGGFSQTFAQAGNTPDSFSSTVIGSDSSCEGVSHTYEAPYVSDVTYTWSATGGVIITPNGFYQVGINWNVPGMGRVEVNMRYPSGFDTTISKDVTVYPSPLPSLYAPFLSCENEIKEYRVVYSPGSTYLWTVTGGTMIGNSTDTLINIHWTNAGNHQVQFRETDIHGCIYSGTIFTAVDPDPIPVIMGDQNVCEGSLMTYNLASPSGGTYEWTSTGGTLMSSNADDNVQIQWTTPGTYQLRIQEWNRGGCDSSSVMTIYVHPSSAISVTGNALVCPGDTVTYNAQGPANNTFQWNVQGGTVVNGTVQGSVQIAWENPGNFPLQVNESSGFGCATSGLINVQVREKPQSAFSGNMFGCPNQSMTFIAAQNPNYTYLWSHSNGQAAGPLNTNQLTLTWNDLATSNVSLSVTDQNGCRNDSAMAVNIAAAPLAMISGPDVICYPNISGNYFTALNNNYTYTWSVNGGQAMTSSTAFTLDVAWNLTGSNSLDLTVIDQNTGCTTLVQRNIAVERVNMPTLSLAPQNCAPFTFSYNASQPVNGQTYSWNFGNGNSALQLNTSQLYRYPGTYDLQLTVRTPAGCTGTTNTSVVVLPRPRASFNASTEGIEESLGALKVSTENISQGADTYIWRSGDGQTSTAFEPVFTYKAPGVYNLQLITINSDGCRDSVFRFVEVKSPEVFYVPNAFSPNGDNMNDYFSVLSNNISEFSISIFDRWGKLVYSSDDKDFQWDGTFMGRPLDNGKYAYIISATGIYGGAYETQGAVMVLR